jgi:hypothetical protein
MQYVLGPTTEKSRQVTLLLRCFDSDSHNHKAQKRLLAERSFVTVKPQSKRVGLAKFIYIYIYAVHDRMFDKLPASNTVCTPHVYWFWLTLKNRKHARRLGTTALHAEDSVVRTGP